MAEKSGRRSVSVGRSHDDPSLGKTPPALWRAMTEWPVVSAPMAEALTGASRAAVLCNLTWMEARGLIDEVTGRRGNGCGAPPPEGPSEPSFTHRLEIKLNLFTADCHHSLGKSQQHCLRFRQPLQGRLDPLSPARPARKGVTVGFAEVIRSILRQNFDQESSLPSILPSLGLIRPGLSAVRHDQFVDRKALWLRDLNQNPRPKTTEERSSSHHWHRCGARFKHRWRPGRTAGATSK